ncbi:ribosome biogenesis GTPase YqeH [Fundicoccus culcitae]|uniref:Ribosome biogenesis GTPase YqeH n=1 Tax=Fundicoccus culcitae TaxID=2969821 RepID=A0ABY5P649_9LACT|nr:ribosome biogenesis GTPase YqeH [Fundicoccus culcitae]UUX34197.1 ribosome biogenesis GTPase YqeH [Fundicoccus culcitae]
MTDIIQCVGCGSIIQTTDPEQAGYLPASALEKSLEKGTLYCQRCFKLRHYNQLQDLTISDDVFLDKLSEIAEDKAFVICMIDIFDVEGSLIHGLPRFIGNQPFIVFVNKMDLLPKSTNQKRVKQWIQRLLKDNGLYPNDIILGSASKNNTLADLREIIEKEARNSNIYIVGVTNVGKSTLINHLIEYYGGDKEVITTSNHPGTTLDMIKVPVNDKYAIIDTPGVIHRTQLTLHLNREELKMVLPNKMIKPTTFQLNPDQTIFIGGIGRVDFIKGEKTSFTFYVSNNLYLHRTKTERATTFYDDHIGELLQPPFKENLESFGDLSARTIKLSANQDIAISGLGWFTVNHDVEVVLWIPKGVGVSIRDSII